MKIKLCAMIAIATGVLSTQVSANGFCLNTSKCSGFPVKWRWKAVAQVYNVGVPSLGSALTCNASYNAATSKQNGCAYQYAANQGGSWSINGWVSQKQCARGNQKSQLMESLLPSLDPPTAADDDLQEESQITTAGQVNYTDAAGSTGYVVVQGLKGYMRANSDMISSFGVKLWIRSNDSDETIDASELIYDGSIVIINGDVKLNGGFVSDFSSSLYSSSAVDGKTTVNFSGGDLTIKVAIPAGYTMDDIVVIGETDGTANDATAKSRVQQKTEEAIVNQEIKFNVFPNPSSDAITLDYTTANTESSVKVSLYNVEGKLLNVLSNKTLKKNEALNIKVSDSSAPLNNGTYFIVIEDGSNKYLKKFIKQ